jgi:uncharacterized protein YbaP (TraB family)
MQRNFVFRGGLAAIALAAALMLPVRGAAPLAEPVATAAAAGPPLWRVSRGEHELWLFGTVSNVPKDLAWDPRAVAAAIAASDEVLSPPGARAAVTLNPVQLMRAWRRARELSKNPKGTELEDVMPRDLYRRYAELHGRYAQHARGLEQARPIIAAARLYEAAVEGLDLESGRDVQETIERLARRAKREPTDAQLHVDPEALLDQAARVTKQAELDCVAKVFTLIERGERIDARARAWAAGDVAALRALDRPDIRKHCLESPGWPEDLRRTLRAADDRWFEAAERALATNRSTFATLDMRELIAADGLLARFRERGYEIREP